QHGVEIAGHPRPYLDAIDRLDSSDEVEGLGDRLALGHDRAHGNRGRLRLLRTGDDTEAAHEQYGADRKAHVGPPVVALHGPASVPNSSTDLPTSPWLRTAWLFGWATAVTFEAA